MAFEDFEKHVVQNMSHRALITGASGQDGSYLVEFLLARAYEVHGHLDART